MSSESVSRKTDLIAERARVRKCVDRRVIDSKSRETERTKGEATAFPPKVMSVSQELCRLNPGGEGRSQPRETSCGAGVSKANHTVSNSARQDIGEHQEPSGFFWRNRRRRNTWSVL